MTQPHSSHTSRGSSLELSLLRTEPDLLLDTPDTPSLEFVSSSSPFATNSSASTVLDSDSTANKQPRAPESSPAPVMAVKAMVPLLVGMMLLTGCCNTLLTKYQVRFLPTAALDGPCS